MVELPSFLVSADSLRQELQSASRPVLVDVREPEEFEQVHIEGCKLIPLGEIQRRAGELDPKTDIVLYCAHGIRSMHALRALHTLGFSKLRSLDGGMASWLGDPDF